MAALSQQDSDEMTSETSSNVSNVSGSTLGGARPNQIIIVMMPAPRRAAARHAEDAEVKEDAEDAGEDDAPTAPTPECPVVDAAAEDEEGKRGAQGGTGNRRRRAASPIRNHAVEDYSTDELHYYKRTARDVRRRIADMEGRIHGLNDEGVPLRFKVLLSDLDDRVKAIAMRKVTQLAQMDASSSEYHKIMAWVTALTTLPIGRYKTLPVSVASPPDAVAAFLHKMRAALDSEVYGHQDAKGHILRLLARWITNPDAKGLVIGIHGEMGTGKTSLCKAVCNVLGLPFAFIPLGGANDGCYLDGHSYTYEGAIWGKIADVLMKCKCMNPVLFFDEVDKVSESHRGQEIIHLLIHLTDPSQNEKFNDKYFVDVEMDLSRSLVVFSYNDPERVSPILLDRMTRVHTDGYTVKDKLTIAHEHLLPSVLAEYGMQKGAIVVSDDLLRQIVTLIDEEQGVRNLRRALVDIVSNLNMERLLSADAPKSVAPTPDVPLRVTAEHVKAYVCPQDSKSTRARVPNMYM